mgnify:CR=1 FL=1
MSKQSASDAKSGVEGGFPDLYCRNRRCREMRPGDSWLTWKIGLCSSCRFLAGWMVSAGIILSGLAAVVGVLLKWVNR